MKENPADNLIQLKKLYLALKPGIETRLKEFSLIGKSIKKETLFPELAFCLFTPQSKAKSCWKAVCTLKEKGLLHSGKPARIEKIVSDSGVRFKKNKTGYLIESRGKYAGVAKKISEYVGGGISIYELREWLVDNIKGYGYKEASHFLRNIGFGQELAILDRHILKNLKSLGAIKEVPASITPAKYLEMEIVLQKFARKAGIPVAHFDLLLWAKEAGEIFK